jgi:hypothetical protein
MARRDSRPKIGRKGYLHRTFYMLQGEVPQHGRLRDSPSRGNVMHEYGRVGSGRTARRESFAPAGPTKFKLTPIEGPKNE